MLPASSPGHENLAAELLPIEYRLLTLFLIVPLVQSVWTLICICGIVQRKVHQAPAREQIAESAAGGLWKGEDRHPAGPAGGSTQGPEWTKHWEQVRPAHLCSLWFRMYSSSLFQTLFCISLLRPTCRLKQERVCELQQQVEDLQKALQIQAIKPDAVRESPSLKAQK